MSYLKIKNLNTKLDKFSLEVENLEIEKGSFFGVLGHSGAGKSTFLNLLCGLEDMQSGNIFLDGEDITLKASHKRGLAYVFQNSLLFEGLSVKENLEYILKAKGINKIEFDGIINKALLDCEIENLKNRDINNLSGGEKQRVALSMALMLKPKLLILDEPFSNLDTSLKISLRNFLKSLVKKHHITVVMVTHDKQDAFELFDKMILLEKGKVLQVGSPKEIYENPNSIKCAKYFGIENILYGNIKNNVFTNKDISLLVNSKDIKKAILILPVYAIRIDDKGEVMKLRDCIYIEGRWKNELENTLIFYSQNELKEAQNIKIDISRIIIKEEV